LSASDGFKAWTNYNQKFGRRPYDPRREMAGVIAAGLTRQALCAQGDHDEAVAKPGYVTRLAHGVRVEPGTSYCRYCSSILDAAEVSP